MGEFMKKRIFMSLLAMASLSSKVHTFEYINDRPVTASSILTGDAIQHLTYNVFNNGNGELGNKRLFGYHNMAVNVPGYAPVHLVKDDVCKSPANFTLLSKFMADTNPIVQRWACIKWVADLNFAFKVENDELYVTSGNDSWKIFAPFRETRKVKLQKNGSEITGGKIEVDVNGRVAAIDQDQVLRLNNIFFIQAVQGYLNASVRK